MIQPGDSTETAGLLKGQIAVVTGSSSGIGRAMVERFAAAGARVIVHARKSSDRAREVCDGIRQRGGVADVVLADLRDPAERARLLDEASSRLGPPDIWVNNAGADVLTGTEAELDFDTKLELLWSVDVRASIDLTRTVGARMKAGGRGVILNVGWDQADTGMEGDSGELFAATKGAVMAFSKSAAVSFAPEVRINCLAPGWIRTAWGETAPSEWNERVLRETPAGRWGHAEDVAALALFLVSDAAQFVTGQVVRVNGGAVR